jgi:hypothetical protein
MNLTVIVVSGLSRLRVVSVGPWRPGSPRHGGVQLPLVIMLFFVSKFKMKFIDGEESEASR